MLSQGKMITSTFLFGMGWFIISFTFPLEAEHYNLGHMVTGLLGLAVSVPFPLVAYLYLKRGDRHLFKLLLFAQILIALFSFIFLVHSRVLFVILVIITGSLQGFYWVSLEVSMGSVPGKRTAEKYSVAWGIPSFISPVIAGYLLQYISFNTMVILSAIILAAAIPLVQKYRIGEVPAGSGDLDAYNIVPLIFAGIVLGFFSYSLIPMLRISGFEYYVLGIYGSVLGGSMALGFLAFSVLKADNIRTLNLLSAVLMATPIMIAFSRNVYLLGTVTALSGFGVAVAFSKVLAYIFRTADPVRGTYYYELFLAIGYGSGSTLGGVLAAYLGYNSLLVVFLFPFVYLAYLLRNKDRRYYSPAA